MRGGLAVTAKRLIKLGTPLLQTLLSSRDRAHHNNLAALDVHMRTLTQPVRDRCGSPQYLGRRAQLHGRDEVSTETMQASAGT